MRAVALFLVALALATGPLRGQEEGREPEEVPARRWQLFPSGDLYPRYLANPDAPATGVTLQFFSSAEIEQAGNRRQHVKLGGSFPLVGWGGRRPGGRRWHLRLDGALDAQFDPSNQTDNTGWDGNYGLIVASNRDGGGLAFRVGTFHISAHLGDEWILRTGRERINYRREEFLAGVAWVWGEGDRVYLEGGWAYDVLSPLQERTRVEAGIEIERAARWLPRATGWYAALDFSAWEERDWKLDAGAQIGLVTRPHGRTWRLGLQYWDGRVPLGEFFLETEAYLALGLWTEL